MSDMLKAWLLIQKAESLYWGATASTLGYGVARYASTRNPASLRLGAQMASFGIRAHVNSVRGVLNTPLVRGRNLSLGGALARGAGAVTGGYILGSVWGEVASYALFGREGQMKARELYSSPRNFYDKAILGAGENVKTIFRHYL